MQAQATVKAARPSLVSFLYTVAKAFSIWYIQREQHPASSRTDIQETTTFVPQETGVSAVRYTAVGIRMVYDKYGLVPPPNGLRS